MSKKPIWTDIETYNVIGYGNVTLMTRDDEIYLIKVQCKSRKRYESFISRQEADWYISMLINMSFKLTNDTYLKLDNLVTVTELPVGTTFEESAVIGMFASRQDSSASGESVLLWHGTLLKNLPSILKRGFKLPSTCGGRMFGAGIYFANKVEKSLNYTDKTGPRVLLLCDVKLGLSITMTEAKEFVRCPEGYDSVFAPGSVGGLLANDEYVIYEPARARVKYVVILGSA
jgi:hypothetical protein